MPVYNEQHKIAAARDVIGLLGDGPSPSCPFDNSMLPNRIVTDFIDFDQEQCGQPFHIHFDNNAFDEVSHLESLSHCFEGEITINEDEALNGSDVEGNAPMTLPVSLDGYDLFTDQEKSLLRIVAYCDFRGCPRNFFDGLMAILAEEVATNQLSFAHKIPCRDTLIKKVTATCPAPPPIAEVISLETATKQRKNIALNNHPFFEPRQQVVMFRYDFFSQLLDLLSDDAIFGNLHNLDVNKGIGDNRYGRFTRRDGMVLEANSASWYQKAYSSMIQNPSKEFSAAAHILH